MTLPNNTVGLVLGIGLGGGVGASAGWAEITGVRVRTAGPGGVKAGGWKIGRDRVFRTRGGERRLFQTRCWGRIEGSGRTCSQGGREDV